MTDNDTAGELTGPEREQAHQALLEVLQARVDAATRNLARAHAQLKTFTAEQTLGENGDFGIYAELVTATQTLGGAAIDRKASPGAYRQALDREELVARYLRSRGNRFIQPGRG